MGFQPPRHQDHPVGGARYNFGFFALLAYSPFPLEAAGERIGVEIGARQLGLVFFGWGLALAISSVVVAPRLVKVLGRATTLATTLGLLTVVMAVMALEVSSLPALVASIVVAGLLLGVMNTVLTESVMEATTLPRSVASSTYSGVRFLGGAVAAAVAGPLAEAFGAPTPYWIAATAFTVAAVIVLVNRHRLSGIHEVAEDTVEEAELITAGDA